MEDLSQINAFDVLRERGFIAQCTDEDGCQARLGQGPVAFYIGFDATADSLHVGHLLSLMAMRKMAALGHQPIALVGGATSLIGDPSFRNKARPVLSREAVESNIHSITKNIRQVVDTSSLLVVNNADWTASTTFLDFMRNVGTHFTVSRMLSMETVKSRLDAQEPLTMLEFSYMMLQANDFHHLSQTLDCELQMGGSDQWGNIVNGIELARRTDGRKLFGLTTHLLTTADGRKMGKTETGAVWLSADKTTPFEFWQFWRNVADTDVERFLRIFTDVPIEEIRAICSDDNASAINHAKTVLANHVTAIVHGKAAAMESSNQAAALFNGEGEPSLVEISADSISGLLDLLRALGWVTSNNQARKLIQGNAVKIDGKTVTDEKTNLVPGMVFDISTGKKNRARIAIK